MNEPSKLMQQHVDMIGAYDDRKRLFDTLRDLTLSDEDRERVMGEYAAASRAFDKSRELVLHAGDKVKPNQEK